MNQNDLTERLVGSFSARVLHIQNIIGNIMTEHICSVEPEKAAILLYSIRSDTNFRTKINIFLNMLRIYYEGIYEKHAVDLKRLYELDEYRTDLAGLMISTPEGTKAQEEHESKTLLCIKLAAILNSIQREIALSGISHS